MILSPVFRQRFFDENGAPLAGGLLYTYAAGTTTPLGTFSNETGTTNANPVVLDAYGYADVWLDPTLAYKFVLEDSLNNVQWTVDNVSNAIGITTWSTNTTYSQGQIVEDSSGAGILYVSMVNSNQGNALTDVSAWRIFEGAIRTVSTNTTLAVTDDILRSNSTAGSLTHTLPACSTTPVGKRILIKDVGTGGNTTSIQGNGSDNIDGNNVYSGLLNEYYSIVVINNGSSWDVVRSAIPNQAITQPMLAARTVSTTAAPLGGVLFTASSGLFTTSSSSYVQPTNLTGSLVTSGRPVKIMLISDASIQGYLSPGATNVMFVQIIRDSTVIYLGSVGDLGEEFYPPGCINQLDAVSAGTHTYTVNVLSQNAVSMNVHGCVLAAYEI